MVERRVAVVTGVTPGNLGHAIAQRLASAGMAVTIADLDPRVNDVCEALTTSCEQNARFMAHVGDLSDEAIVQSMIDRTIEKFGRVDVLVNNAGRGVITPFLQHTADTLTATLKRNLWTTLWCCHKALPHMVARNHGRIINIGADSLRTGIPDHAGYNAAKGGVIGLMVGLAREFAPHDITVNTVSPCVINTERFQSHLRDNPEWAKQFLAVVPKGRGAETSEIVDMVAFFARQEAGFITGQDISVNGGSAMP